MKLELGSGPSTQPVDIPDRNLLGIIEPERHEPFHEIETALRRAAEETASFLGPARRVLVLVNDRTRPTPSGLILSSLASVLRQRAVRVLVCLGAHRPAVPAELDLILGPEMRSLSDLNVVQHDCRSVSSLFLMGRTTKGTEVRMNREILWAERIIAVNSVEPHYFAGFTGGRKSFLPGIAGIDGIVQNHNLAVHTAAMPLALEGNPVHADMVEAAQMVPRPIFSIQTVQDRDLRLLSVRSGSLQDSFNQACADARRSYGLTVGHKADIVLSVVRPPGDINLYQSQRAVEFAQSVLNSPSVHITVSSCREGIGDDGFIRTLLKFRDPNEILSQPNGFDYSGWHKAVRLVRIRQRTDLYAVTGLDPDVIRSAVMTPFATVQEAIDAAISHIGPDARVYVIPDAAAVVPIYAG